MLISIKHLMQIERAHADGTVAFRDGSSVRADIILHCTGYEPKSLIHVNNQNVGNSLALLHLSHSLLWSYITRA